MSDPRRTALLKLEEARRAALVAADFDALDRLLADDLVHVHGTGIPGGKAHYFEDIRNRFSFVEITRGEPEIRFLGDAALMTGPMLHKVRLKATGDIVTMAAFGTQIWVPAGGGWKQIFYQATPIKSD